jgi:hypothetical protein
MSFETTALLVTWVAIVLLGLVVAGLLRQVHVLTRGPRNTPELGLTSGVPAPQIARLAPEAGRSTLLLFLRNDCGSCDDVLHEALGLAAEHPVRAIFETDAIEVKAPAGMKIYSGERELFHEYKVPATPFAVLADENGRVETAVPVGSVRGLRELLGIREGSPR